MTYKNFADQIDNILPQTQCGLCGYKGCRPYAQAIAENKAEINLCPPGGVETLKKLANITGKNAEPYLANMQEKIKPAQIAFIRESECIGCTKCIRACPTDAIIGASKLMHTIITDACTGCGLCVPPCPVDCIDMITVDEPSNEQKQKNADRWRSRYENHLNRLTQEEQEELIYEEKTLEARKIAINAAVARVKLKKKIN